jgi:hypothetical protein
MASKLGQGPANPVYLISGGDGSADATVNLAAGSTVAISSITVPAVIYNGKTSVATPGTQVVLASSQAILSGVTIKAEADNTGIIYVGDSTVQSSDGFELAAGEQVFIEIANLSTVWIDASVGTDGVSYVAS